MGYGAQSENKDKMEGLTSTHGQPLSKAGVSIKNTILNLGGDPEKPFKVSDEVNNYYSLVLRNKRKLSGQKKEVQKVWKNANPEQSALLNKYLSGNTQAIDYEQITYKPDAATRNTSGDILSYFAANVGNMIVMSADLSNSDKTEGFLKHSHPLRPGDFSGGFLHAGVSELTMAAIANGMALHGGVQVACGTFFVFSDYMKPAIRLAALMGLPVKYVFTHDSFRVGEDGPTHQPVEQEMQLRLLEHLKNHRGENSLLVLRPADSAETVVSWKIALENTKTPTALILSRQNIRDIPAPLDSTRFKHASNIAFGAYTVLEPKGKPDIILLANGSEVATLIECASFLEKEQNIKCKVVSAPSEGLFRLQSVNYQKQIIPDDIPVFGLTAGLPITLKNLAGCKGKVFGLEHFGYSAPYQILDEKFGFTALNICKSVIEYLKPET